MNKKITRVSTLLSMSLVTLALTTSLMGEKAVVKVAPSTKPTKKQPSFTSTAKKAPQKPTAVTKPDVAPQEKEQTILGTSQAATTKPLSKKEARQQKRAQKKEKERIKREKNKKPEKKVLRDMSYDELKAAKNRQLQAGDKSSAMRYLEKMIPLCTDLQERPANMLELADILFDNGELEKAGKVYTEFTQLYSGNIKVEYASYKSVLCSFYGTLSSDRDQTKTVDTIEHAEKFLERSSVFTTYTPEVQKIASNCRKKLFDNQVGIFTFYFNRGRYTSAQKRLENIRKDFVVLLPEAEPHILVLESELAAKLNNTTLMAEKQAELAIKFPTYHQDLLVAQSKNSRRFINRF